MPKRKSVSGFMKASQHPSGGVLRAGASRYCRRCAVRTSASGMHESALAPATHFFQLQK
jgi:hypothetical protein